MLALLADLAAMVAVFFLLSTLHTQAVTLTVNSIADSGPGTLWGHERFTVATSLLSTQSAVAWDNKTAEDDEACTIGVATGDSTGDGRPVLWKNRDFFGHSAAWQANLFWHKATGQPLSASYATTDRFNYVAVSDRGDWSDPQDITETLYYPRMGANERGLAVVSAQAHTLSAAAPCPCSGPTWSGQSTRSLRCGRSDGG